MRLTFVKPRMWISIFVGLAFLIALACAASEEPQQPLPAAAADPAAPAALPAEASAAVPAAPSVAQQLPAPAASARPAAQPEPAVAPAQVNTRAAPARTAPTETEPATAAVVFVPQAQEPGVPVLYGEGYSPRPTTFSENPKFATMVKEGKLPSVEERLPHPGDVFVYAPVDEIGIYGGDARLWGRRLYNNLMSGLAGGGTCARWENDGLSFYPMTCKSFEVSEDGRVYTIKLRKELKWSDGTPFTMEDVEWVWSEDLNYNKELNKTTPSNLQDPVTGEPVKFNVVDDHTFTLSFDNPNHTFIDGGRIAVGSACSTMSSCMYEPFHFSKKYHPEYADATEFKKIMDDKGYTDWTQVWKGKYSLRYDADIPVTHTYYLCDGGADDQQKLCANPYFHGVDPMGNQLPYLDTYTYNKAESRETSVFRSMSGETDGPYSGDFLLSEVPLYIAHMEQGDYSIGRWPKRHGNDGGIQVNPEYNVDPELGRWFRTKEFRQALSLGMDRSKINQVVFLGLGTPQSWVPHPTTPYYPGDEWAGHHAQPDVAKANALLDGLGLVDTDGDGFRNRLDGTGNLEFFSEFRGNFIPVVQMMAADWEKIGIKMEFKEGRNRAFGRGEAPIRMRAMSIMTNPWYWTQFLPYRASHPGREMGRYFETGGKEGMAPVGAPVIECPTCSENEFLPLAIKGRYPADPDGFLMEMQKHYRDGKQYSMLDPNRIENGKALYRLNLENSYHLGTVAFTGDQPGIVFKRNNLRNVPDSFGRHEYYGYESMLWHFEDGIDNLNHPGNKSIRYASTHFLKCVHIASEKC